LGTVIDGYELAGWFWQVWNDSSSILDEKRLICQQGYRKGLQVMPSGHRDTWAGEEAYIGSKRR